jgi:tyrosyl-tRNA synthetase
LNEYEVDESDEHAVLDLLQSTGFITSNKEGRRKLQEGAVQLNGKKVKELRLKIPKELLEKGVVLKLGRKMIKIKKKQK